MLGSPGGGTGSPEGGVTGGVQEVALGVGCGDRPHSREHPRLSRGGEETEGTGSATGGKKGDSSWTAHQGSRVATAGGQREEGLSHRLSCKNQTR